MRERTKLRDKLTYANVMVTILAFIVLGGSAFAALGKNTVGTRQLKRNAVKVGKIAPEAVRAGKLAKDAIATNRLREGVVTTEKIADNAVNQDKLATDSVGASELKGLTTRTNSVSIGPGASASTNVSCLGNEQIISAGTHWGNFENNLEMNYIRISGNTAIGRGNNDTATNRTFFVDAYCLSN